MSEDKPDISEDYKTAQDACNDPAEPAPTPGPTPGPTPEPVIKDKPSAKVEATVETEHGTNIIIQSGLTPPKPRIKHQLSKTVLTSLEPGQFFDVDDRATAQAYSNAGKRMGYTMSTETLKGGNGRVWRLA